MDNEFNYGYIETDKIHIVNLDGFLSVQNKFKIDQDAFKGKSSLIFWLKRADNKSFNQKCIALKSAGYTNFKLYITNDMNSPPSLNLFNFENKVIKIYGHELSDYSCEKYKNKSARDYLFYKNLLYHNKTKLYYIKGDLKTDIGPECSYCFNPTVYYSYKHELYPSYDYDIEEITFRKNIYIFAPPRAGGPHFKRFLEKKHKIAGKFFVNEFMHNIDIPNSTIIIIDEPNLSLENKLLIFSHIYLITTQHIIINNITELEPESRIYNSDIVKTYFKNISLIEEMPCKKYILNFIPYQLFIKSEDKNSIKNKLRYYV